VGNITATPATGAPVVEDGGGDRGEAGGDLAFLGGVPAPAGLGQQATQFRQRPGTRLASSYERRRVREQRSDLSGREAREDGPTAGGQMRGQAHADFGDQRRPTGCAILHDVQHLAAVRERQVGAVPGTVDEPGQRGVGHPYISRAAAPPLQ
jgi:hypothetical protein